MKTVKLLSLALAAMAAFSLVSCNDDDDSYTPLTPTEKTQCYQTVRGNYAGKLVYTTGQTTNGKAVADTIDAAWSINNDSTLTIKQFPSRLLAIYVSNADMKKAIEEAPAQDIVCRTNYVQTSPVGLYLNPVAPTFNLTYSKATHKVQVAFYTNHSQSSALYNSEKKFMQLQIIEGAIYVDGKQSSDLKNGSSFYLYGTKL